MQVYPIKSKQEYNWICERIDVIRSRELARVNLREYNMLLLAKTEWEYKEFWEDVRYRLWKKMI